MDNRTRWLTAMAGLPDDAVVDPQGRTEEPPCGPGITLAGTPEGLTRLIRDLHLRKGWVIFPDDVKAAVSHEEAHARAARGVGYQLIRYVLTEVTIRGQGAWEPSVVYTSPSRPVTRLEHAVVLAAPRCLGDGDLRSVRLAGYRGREDVAARAGRHGLAHLMER